MISVTLQFKSLDAALRALKEIPENLLIAAVPVAAAAAAPIEVPFEPVKEAAAPAPKPEKAKKAAAAPADAPAPTIAPVQPEAPAPAAAEPAPIDYPVLQKAVFALAGKDKAAAVAVAQSFGVKTFKDLPPARWSEALGAVQEKLAELENV